MSQLPPDISHLPREAQIHVGNARVFLRRMQDPNYGTREDRNQAARDFYHSLARYRAIMNQHGVGHA